MYCITGTGRSQIALTVGRKQLGAKLECRKGYLRDIYKSPVFKGTVPARLDRPESGING